MRIAHISDLHIARSPTWGEYNPKRLLGYVNYRLFRSRLYQEQIARDALERLMVTPPDLVILTGDITQHGLDVEFDAAHQLLSPICESGIPIIAVAGNHDIYGHTNQLRLNRLLEHLAQPAMPDRRGIYRFPGVEVLPLSQGIPTPIFFSHGLQRSSDLRRAQELWCDPPNGVMRLVCGHYPVIDPHGGRLLYFRGLRQADKLVRFCAEHEVAGYFCGHNHKRFCAPMQGRCVQYAAPALSSVRSAGREWVSVYECGPELENPRDEGPV
ncbi:MAG: metallophosphoesterase [Planctomycetaceae bacterium]|nr:metallophosphoesterase [Planctomycetaceae bacterium]